MKDENNEPQKRLDEIFEKVQQTDFEKLNEGWWDRKVAGVKGVGTGLKTAGKNIASSVMGTGDSTNVKSQYQTTAYQQLLGKFKNRLDAVLKNCGKANAELSKVYNEFSGDVKKMGLEKNADLGVALTDLDAAVKGINTTTTNLQRRIGRLGNSPIPTGPKQTTFPSASEKEGSDFWKDMPDVMGAIQKNQTTQETPDNQPPPEGRTSSTGPAASLEKSAEPSTPHITDAPQKPSIPPVKPEEGLETDVIRRGAQAKQGRNQFDFENKLKDPKRITPPTTHEEIPKAQVTTNRQPRSGVVPQTEKQLQPFIDYASKKGLLKAGEPEKESLRKINDLINKRLNINNANIDPNLLNRALVQFHSLNKPNVQFQDSAKAGIEEAKKRLKLKNITY